MKSTCDNTFETDLGVTSMLGLRFGNVRANVGLLLVASVLAMCVSQSAFAAWVLPLGVEQDVWSDMNLNSNVLGNYDSGDFDFTASAGSSNDLEIGSQFGPSNSGRHYGTSGTLGGPFAATMSLTGVTI